MMDYMEIKKGLGGLTDYGNTQIKTHGHLNSSSVQFTQLHRGSQVVQLKLLRVTVNVPLPRNDPI